METSSSSKLGMKEWLGQQKTKKKLGRHHARARKQYEIGAEANDTEEYKCVKPVRLREGETRRQAIKRVKDGDEVCSKEGEVYPGMEKATNANKLQCLNYCTSEYLPPSQETNASEQGPPPASEPSQRARPASRENSNAAPNKERGLVLSSKKSKNSSVVPFDESKLPRVPEEKTEDDEEAPSAPEKKEEGEEEKPKDTKPKAEKKSKRQKAWDYTKRKRNELRGKMKDTQREIKELEPDPLKVGPVTVPASVVGFIEKNAKRFELIGLALWDFPFELTFHFFKEIGHIMHILAAGFLWIGVWMAVEAFAKYVSEGVLLTIVDVINVMIRINDMVIQIIKAFVFGVIVPVLQVALCDFPLLSSALPSGLKKLICHKVDAFGPPPFHTFNTDKFVPALFEDLKVMTTTCAEFSNGFQILEGILKLIFSPSLCPVVRHVRPVGWLYDMFYYTLGTLTWAQGTTPGYTDPLASLVTKQKTNAGVRGSTSCEQPPDVVWCVVFGGGFLIVEILVPLIIVFMILTPMKTIIKNCIGIAFSLTMAIFTGIIDFCEKSVSTAQWAGPGLAWLIIMIVPMIICAPVGYALFGFLGLAFGAAAGSGVGGYIAFERGGNFFEGPGPKRILILWVANVVIATGLGLFIEFAKNIQKV